MKQVILTAFAAALLVGCGPSTKIVKSWQEPGATFQVTNPTNKILIIAMVKDETSRRVVEDNLAKRIGSTAVASYVFFTPDALKAADSNMLGEKLKQDKFTHVLMMRLAEVDEETSYVPGTTSGFYGGYGGYYGYGAGFYSTPGYYTTDKNYMVESTVYSVEPDKLLWTGTTKTVNPTKIENTVNEIADAVATKMRTDGFLK